MQVWGFDQPGQMETIPSAVHFERVLKGFNLSIRGSLHESALFFKL